MSGEFEKMLTKQNEDFVKMLRFMHSEFKKVEKRGASEEVPREHTDLMTLKRTKYSIDTLHSRSMKLFQVDHVISQQGKGKSKREAFIGNLEQMQ